MALPVIKMSRIGGGSIEVSTRPASWAGDDHLRNRLAGCVDLRLNLGRDRRQWRFGRLRGLRLAGILLGGVVLRRFWFLRRIATLGCVGLLSFFWCGLGFGGRLLSDFLDLALRKEQFDGQNRQGQYEAARHGERETTAQHYRFSFYFVISFRMPCPRHGALAIPSMQVGGSPFPRLGTRSFRRVYPCDGPVC